MAFFIKPYFKFYEADFMQLVSSAYDPPYLTVLPVTIFGNDRHVVNPID
jgi:hypothetical protein